MLHRDLAMLEIVFFFSGGGFRSVVKHLLGMQKVLGWGGGVKRMYSFLGACLVLQVDCRFEFSNLKGTLPCCRKPGLSGSSLAFSAVIDAALPS